MRGPAHTRRTAGQPEVAPSGANQAMSSTTVLAALVLLMPMAARAQAGGVYRPAVPILCVAHEGDPVPGVSGAVFEDFAPPQIDAVGNVLFRASMSGSGIHAGNNVAIWFGPPGASVMVARDGWPAPGMPAGVICADVSPWAVVSETGRIAFTAFLSGPGIVAGLNDQAVFCGDPGDFQLIKQGNDPVPEIGPAVTIDANESLGAALSDNGTLFIGGGISGPGLVSYARAYWVGPPEAPQLAQWDGMPAPCPECEPGVILEWGCWISFNDLGQIAFCGSMWGPGINWTNNGARWIGPPNELEFMYREGQLVPVFGEGVKVLDAWGTQYTLNNCGDRVNRICVYHPDYTSYWALVAGAPQPTTIIAREGDAAPEAGDDVCLAAVGNLCINDRHEVLHDVRFSGPSIGEWNEYGIYYGPYADRRLILRNSDAADYFPDGVILHNVGAVSGTLAMNDVGDFVARTEVETSARGRTTTMVLWMWRGLTGQYVPLLEDGAQVGGRAATIADYYGQYWTRTGGADGQAQSFNDQRQLATLLDFTDGTYGVYRVGPPLLGDADGDGEVTCSEFGAFASCVTAPGNGVLDECSALDLDLDQDIDVADFGLLQALVGEVR